MFRVEEALLATCFLLVSCLSYSSTLKMEAVHSSEMMVDVCQTAQLYILENNTLHSHCSENLKFCNRIYQFDLVFDFIMLLLIAALLYSCYL
jgi:hypothetical protein